ncbi:fatty acid desaturase-domain-containing protein [Cristinia sonorae]|uniref:Fatty acid desaturase-domain-containing protein n=1 Tax=Cristinia sonorae TaxID=1940300 RepID=A0A8K0US81_9AGAR|nr:fatty acid desaturase-domain-containing protein [Cristinia sonorae]
MSVTELSTIPPQEKYVEETLPEFTPMPWTIREIRNAIPEHLFVRDTIRGLLYLTRDLLLAAITWKLATFIDPFFRSAAVRGELTPFGAEIARWASWCTYWWFQGLIFTGIWVIGHECGHGAFSDSTTINDIIGFVTHSFLWTPYFSWKISHHRHHKAHACMERDEVYVPKTRSQLGIPKLENHEIEWEDYFGDTPIYTLLMLLRQQFLAFPAYLIMNVSGQKDYPAWTNHFDRTATDAKVLSANSILFTKGQRNRVIMSNLGLLFMAWGVKHSCATFGSAETLKYYGIPWLLVTHWFIMITYLHHTDANLPHYRGKEWNYQRGAAATVDRPFLGWQGRFFLHDVAHYHVIHHFFPKMPFYHGEEATQYLKAFIGEHYAWSDKPVFSALWETYNKCQFVEDDGEILFYRDRQGRAVRRPAAAYRK